jgi:hypothetical protein
LSTATSSGIKAMSKPESEEIPTRVTNNELEKMVREQKVANKAFTQRLQELEKNLDNKDKQNGFEDEEGSDEEEDDS